MSKRKRSQGEKQWQGPAGRPQCTVLIIHPHSSLSHYYYSIFFFKTSCQPFHCEMDSHFNLAFLSSSQSILHAVMKVRKKQM